jgi:CDP-glucose 4,6-dehydratase
MSTFWRDRPTLVTGASGLVGGWLVRRLLAEEASVVCLVRDWVPSSILLGGTELDRVVIVRGAVEDLAVVERTLGEYEIDTVFHLAAQTIVPIANRNPLSTFESNIRGTWTVLEACRRSPKVHQIVVASSDKAYGAHATLPYDEDAPLRGVYPYDVSKSCSDLIAQSYAHSFQLPVVITRCGNFFGGGDLNWSRLVPGTIRSLIRHQRPVIRSDGTLERDYFYVEDGAAAYLLAAERLSDDRSLAGHAFNFSNEAPLTVMDLTRRIITLFGSDLEPEVQGTATNEIPAQWLSASKARRLLGWSPGFSLEEGLRRTISWYETHFQTNQLPPSH